MLVSDGADTTDAALTDALLGMKAAADALKQSVIVENRAGANGNLGADLVDVYSAALVAPAKGRSATR